MKTEKRIDFVSTVYDRINGLSTQADGKAAIILSLHTLLATIITPYLGYLVTDFSKAGVFQDIFWGLALCITLFFVFNFVRSVVKTFHIFVPRLPWKREVEKKSLLFFIDICNMSKSTSLEERGKVYHEALEETTEEGVIQDYSKRICDVSQVVKDKFSTVGEAYKLSIWTFVSWFLALIFLYFYGKLFGAI